MRPGRGKPWSPNPALGCFPSCPGAPLGLELVFLDLHGDGLPSYFDANTYRTHLYAKAVVAEAARAIFEFIETFYNRERLHSALGCQSPVDYENNLN